MLEGNLHGPNDQERMYMYYMSSIIMQHTLESMRTLYVIT